MIADEQTCELCNGTGWKPVQKDGRSVVQRCDCQVDTVYYTRAEKANIPRRFLGMKLDSYITIKENPSVGEAKKVVGKFIDDYPAVSKGFLLQGPTGVGKTKLLCSVASELIKKIKDIDIFYIDWNDLVRDMRSGDHIVSKDYSNFNQMISRLVSVELLLFDELGAVTTTPWILDYIYYIFNKRYNDQRVTLCASNYLDKSIDNQETLTKRIGERIRSRLYEMSQVVEIRGEDIRKH